MVHSLAQVPRAREEPRPADARRQAGGGRRHHHLARQARARASSSPPIRRSTPSRPSTASAIAGRHEAALRFRLRAKLALVALVLLVLPWAGWLYVREMERFLLAGRSRRCSRPRARWRPRCTSGRSCCLPGARRLAARDEAERELRRLTGGAASASLGAHLGGRRRDRATAGPGARQLAHLGGQPRLSTCWRSPAA